MKVIGLSTLNGQLLLTMLAEQLEKISFILQCNTDGVTVKIHKSKLDEMKRIIKWWEDLTQLELEDAYYSKMVIGHVNSYIAVYTNGKVKYKGAFEIDKEIKGELQYHKDHSSRVVAIAVSKYFIEGIPIRESVLNHLNNGDYGKIKNHGIYDFCIGKKTKGGKKGRPDMIFKEMINGELRETKLQKTNRYYISKSGGQLVKRYREQKYDKDLNKMVEVISESTFEVHPQKGRFYKVKVFNNYEELDDYNIDYNYYTREANKIINSVVDFNYSLF